MNNVLQSMYGMNFFKRMPHGLPEAILSKEEELGRVLSGELNAKARRYDYDELTVWLGKVGDWFFIGLEKDRRCRYELFENQIEADLFFVQRAKGLPLPVKGFWRREIQSLIEN